VFDLLDRGVATASEIDRAIRGSMGLRLAALGPLAIIDHAGWDISAATFANLIPDMQSDTRIPDVIQKMLDQGQLGTKSGQGVYEYPAETVDQAVAQRDADYLSLVRLLHACEDSK
jgi:3-hydroxybutyryl-CoA dehydrogenase